MAYKPYEESEAVKRAKEALEAHNATKPADYTSNWQSQIDATLSQIQNRKPFTYDLNADALYQQYKDMATAQGSLAMMDTMGQAAALTGGYGSSYGQNVGQQAYNSYLQSLNDKVPELYQLALGRYNQEGEDLYNMYALLGDREANDYAKWQDLQNAYESERNYLTNLYDTERGYDYNKWQADQSQAQWQAEFDEAVRQYNDARSASYSSGGGGGYVYSGGNDDVVVGDTPVADEVSAAIREQAAAYSTNDDLAAFLDAKTVGGAITEAQADALYAEFVRPDTLALSKRNWSVVDDGGINIFGIDRNAQVKDQYNNVYRLDKLVGALEAEGMTKAAAKEYVKKLQKSLGI